MRIALAFVIALAGIGRAGGATAPTASSISLDHVVLAVNDLEAAAAKFRSFGFALKPGRLHDNGIRNEHVKFKDGTELELLTAPEARDDLTTRYRKHLAAGDGPAFLALMVRGAPAPTDRPPYIFFGGRNASPTDTPEHFAHANTAESLVAVWLAGADFRRERALLERFGVKKDPKPLRVLGVEADVMRLADGGVIYFLPERLRVHRDRPIVGVTFRVTDNPRLLAPDVTGGLWIQLAR
jgi:catechol 2,3-dioxygenase-like lactoylglutathione lyase family enzyme